MIDAILALALSFVIGAGCRFFDLPSPAPPRPIGVSPFAGDDSVLRYCQPYPVAWKNPGTSDDDDRLHTVDGWVASPARYARYCGGPSESSASQALS